MKKRIPNLLFLNWKKLLIIIASEFLVVILHNMVYAFFGLEEAIFFILAIFIIPIYFLTAVVYSLWHTLSKIKDSKKAAKLAGIFIITAYGVLVSEITQSNFIVMLADVISGLSVIGIAVLIFPYVKKTGKQIPKIYLFTKTLEGLIMIFAGTLFLIGLKDARSFLYEGLHLWVFIIGSFLFYYLLYITKIVPRFLSIWGFVAISFLLFTTILKLLSISYPTTLDVLLILIISNEITLASWLMIKGFNYKNF